MFSSIYMYTSPVCIILSFLDIAAILINLTSHRVPPPCDDTGLGSNDENPPTHQGGSGWLKPIRWMLSRKPTNRRVSGFPGEKMSLKNKTCIQLCIIASPWKRTAFSWVQYFPIKSILAISLPLWIIYSSSHNHGSWKLQWRKLILKGSIFHFHDCGRKSTFPSNLFLPYRFLYGSSICCQATHCAGRISWAVTLLVMLPVKQKGWWDCRIGEFNLG